MSPEKLEEIYTEASKQKKDETLSLEVRKAFLELEIAARKTEIELLKSGVNHDKSN